MADRAVTQVGGERLDLGKLRHLLTVTSTSVKVVVAHNRYREAIPSGENVIVDTEIAQLRAAGVEVLPFQRSSDSIAAMPAAQKALLPISPIYGGPAQRDLSALLDAERPDLVHLHNPYPLISPWIIRTAHKHGVPVVQTVHNYRQVCSSGLYFRDGHDCRDCRGKVIGYPAVRHKCYRGSSAQSALMATTLAVHRPTWRSVDRFIALTDRIAEHLRDYGIPDDRIVIKPNGLPDPGTPPPPRPTRAAHRPRRSAAARASPRDAAATRRPTMPAPSLGTAGRRTGSRHPAAPDRRDPAGRSA